MHRIHVVEIQNMFHDCRSVTSNQEHVKTVEVANVQHGQNHLVRNVFGATESKFGAARRTQRVGGYVNTS
jgi:hypothetical protein